MMDLQCELQAALSPIADALGLAGPVRVEFSRKGESLFSCAMCLRAGPNAPALAQQAAEAFRSSHAATAQVSTDGGYLNFSPTPEALMREMERLACRVPDADPQWEDPHAAVILRLRADRHFGKGAAFSPRAAQAILRAQARLPYDQTSLLPPLDPLLSRAWESILRERNEP